MDVRLWRQLKSGKTLALGLGVTSLLMGVLIVLQAGVLSRIVSLIYIDHDTLGRIETLALVLLGVIALRAITTGFQEHWALRGAAEIQGELRKRFVDTLLNQGPTDQRLESGAMVTLAVQGIDDLEVFLARYFPQIIVTAAVPAVVWGGVMLHDWVSGAILLVTLPLIPLFMVLIGRQAENHSKRQIFLLTRLSGHFLDVLHGLDTLKLFGQSKRQTKTVYNHSEAFRASTMATLRIAFLSGLVLELIASLSMAFIAVAVGLRLIHSDLSFQTAFMVLVLTPEFYIPWRNLGAKFHDGLKGAAAAKEIFDLMDRPVQALTGGSRIPKGQGPWPLAWEDVSFRYPGRTVEALSHLSLRLEPGEHLAVVGRSGSGKTTFVELLLGLSQFTGTITIDGIPLTELDLDWWRRNVSWVTQRPYLFDGTIRDNLLAVAPHAVSDDLQDALTQSGAWGFVHALPQGVDTNIGQEGLRLSGGQRQRLALARAFLKDSPLIVFDEPTQNLDLAAEWALLGAMERLGRGRSTITIAHRLATVAESDRILVLDKGQMAQWGDAVELRHIAGPYRALLDAYQRKEPIRHERESHPAHQVL
ncbi:thiol reductant ABC exporter subunit CydD [Sulfobacillus harzensis]|uniref:Thiol reductant ABC exporter subunit CydD n=1 Tax=Sulfobacillus harzensis TaxID=2729629 RepID=A0A7Y0L3L7_9FIRM|nr:thiol reductant ABC exporter subunit CydD [Sulfobacillus harzensis]NMP21264.1 thiol reductant ABC exporter subunit CydD [Sulfobacillus harzensis]